MHTQGYWTYTLDAGGRGRIYSGRQWIATTWTHHDDDSTLRYQAESNAKLISAAPDLLLVAELAASALSCYRETGAFAPGQPSGWLLRELNNAIAKATPSTSHALVTPDLTGH